MMRIDLYAVVAGIVAGLGSAMVFQWVSAWIPRVDFWLPATNLARSLVVVGDDEDFLSRYGALLKLLMRYLGRQALTMALPLVLVATIAMLILPPSAERSNPRAADRGSFARPHVMLKNSDLRPKASDFAFFLPLCVGYGVAVILPRRKE
jgi:hypothetical protein